MVMILIDMKLSSYKYQTGIRTEAATNDDLTSCILRVNFFCNKTVNIL